LLLCGCLSFSFSLFFFAGVGPRAVCMLGQCSTAEPHPHHLFPFFCSLSICRAGHCFTFWVGYRSLSLEGKNTLVWWLSVIAFPWQGESVCPEHWPLSC
jgi:hypothetical protein